MTHNQIAYATLKETRRHNLESEQDADIVMSETNRHNVAQENYWTQSNVINKEHYERIDNETQRHNIATENIQAYSAGTQAYQAREAARHNVAMETINTVQAKEAIRHNMASEEISQQQADASTSQAESSAQNATTNFLSQVATGDKIKSEIELNKVRASDYKSQIAKRRVDAMNSTVETGGGFIRDNSTAFKNVINGFTDIIKLVPGI